MILEDGREIRGQAVIRSGVDFTAAAKEVFDLALGQAGLGEEDISAVLATGYGRQNTNIAQETKTEIACQARGCYHLYPEALTIIDIGGQDNKIIKLAADGVRTGFMMNRKCAAGTGAFLEEMAARLAIDLDGMNDLAAAATETVELGAYCTVFSATEVLEKIRAGHPLGAIIRGVFLSMVKRVIEMDLMENRIVLTGGVAAHNPLVAELLAQATGAEVTVPPFPQITGALGAALLAGGKVRS